MIGTQADIKEKVKMNRYSRNWQCNFFCEKCLACRHLPNIGGYDFTHQATWRHMMTSHQNYLATTPEWLRSPWCEQHSWSIYRQRDDLLHLVWLGFAKDVSGQLLYDFAIARPGDMTNNLQALYREMRAWFRDRGVPCNVRPWGKTTISWSSSNDYPTLEGNIKASASKLIFLWASWKAVQIVETGENTSDYSRMRATMAWNLSRFVAILDAEPLFLSDDAAFAACHHGHAFLICYQQLAFDAIVAKVAAYKLRPKLHYFAHTVLELIVTFENPRRQDLFAAEDFIGRIKKIGSKCHRSTTPLRVCQHILLALGQRWAQLRRRRGPA